MNKVINFSGGKTSALMTLMLSPTPNDIVLFCDTGREHPKTYKFIDDFERIEGIQVHRTSYTNKNAPGLTGFDALLANRTDVPNVMRRECTKVLKIRQARRYLRSIGVVRYDNFIGFRHDEQSRIISFKERFEGVKTAFILDESKIIKKDVDIFWQSKPYTLEIPSILGNCDGCFLKGKNNLIKIFAVCPELADKWIKDEKRGTFIKNTSYQELLNIALKQDKTFALDNLAPAFNCSCTA